MSRRLILDPPRLHLTLQRLCRQLIENYGDFQDTVFVGLQPRGIYLSDRLVSSLAELQNQLPPVGHLDITFFRDDFRRRQEPLKANETRMPFIIENKRVVLIDDVLFTGRSVRAALDAMAAYGRPVSVELLVLVDRMHTRELPIEASYTGIKVNTIASQRVLVEWEENQGQVWLLDQTDKKS
jgi:pyrimidine operon attenuation protein / uracil phosphoribosyltransferase